MTPKDEAVLALEEAARAWMRKQYGKQLAGGCGTLTADECNVLREVFDRVPMTVYRDGVPIADDFPKDEA